MQQLEGRQEFTPDGQELPPWQAYRQVTTVIDGVRVVTGEIVPIPQTYYGPSIPLGEGWSYGGSTRPATTASSSVEDPVPSSASAFSTSTSSLSSTTSSSIAPSATFTTASADTATSLTRSSSPSIPSFLSTFQSATTATSTTSSGPSVNAESLDISTSPLSHTLSILLPSLLGSIILSVLLVVCVMCYRRKSQYQKASHSDPDTAHATSSAAGNSDVYPRQDTGTDTDNSPNSNVSLASGTGDGPRLKGSISKGSGYGWYGKLPNPGQVSDESFGDNPLPVTLGEHNHGKRSDSAMYRHRTEQEERAPFLSEKHADGVAQATAYRPGLSGRSEKAIEKDITDPPSLPPTNTTSTPDRRHLLSKLSDSLGLGIGIGAPPHLRAAHTISGSPSTNMRYYSPGTAERYIGGNDTSPGRLPSWAMIADIGESVRRRISGAAAGGGQVGGAGRGLGMGSPGPSILRNANYGDADEKGKHQWSGGGLHGKAEKEKENGKGAVMRDGRQAGGHDVNGGDIPGIEGTRGDQEAHEELERLVHDHPSSSDPSDTKYPRHAFDSPSTRTNAFYAVPHTDSFIGTPSILDNASSLANDPTIDSSKFPTANPIPHAHAAAQASLQTPPHHHASLSQTTQSPQSHARSMSIGESDLFYRKPLTTAASASTLALARDFFRPGPRQMASFGTLRSEVGGQAGQERQGTAGSRMSGVSARTGSAQLGQQGEMERDNHWRSVGMGNSVGSRDTRRSRRTQYTGSSIGTSSRSGSGSGSGSSGPRARSRGRLAPWTRRPGVSPADDFGTPLRELADLADRYEHAYDYGHIGEEDGWDEARGGRIAVTNAALPLGRDDALPVYTVGRYGLPPGMFGAGVAVQEREAWQKGEGQGQGEDKEEGVEQARTGNAAQSPVSGRESATMRLVHPQTPSSDPTSPPLQTISVRVPHTPGTPTQPYDRSTAERGSGLADVGDLSDISQWRADAHAAAADYGAAFARAPAAKGKLPMNDLAADTGRGDERSEGVDGDLDGSSSSGSRLDFPLPPLLPWNVDERERDSTAIASEYHSTGSRASSAASPPPTPHHTAPTTPTSHISHAKTRSLSWSERRPSGAVDAIPPVPDPLPSQARRPTHTRASSSLKYQSLPRPRGADIAGGETESGCEDNDNDGQDVVVTPLMTRLDAAGAGDLRKASVGQGSWGGRDAGDEHTVVEDGQGTGDVISSLKRALNLSGLFRSHASASETSTPTNNRSTRANMLNEQSMISETSMTIDPLADVSLAGPLSPKGAIGWGTATARSPAEPAAKPGKSDEPGQGVVPGREGRANEKGQQVLSSSMVHDGAERRVSVMDIAVSKTSNGEGLMESYVGQVGSGLPVQQEAEEMRSAGWDEFGQLVFRQPEHVLPPLSRHSLSGSFRASDSSPSAYSGDLGSTARTSPEEVQKGQFGLLEPVELRRVNTGTGTEASRVSTVGEIGESRAVRASTATIIRPPSLLPTPLITPMLSSSSHFSPTLQSPQPASSRLSHTSLLGSPIAEQGSWSYLAKLHAAQRGDADPGKADAGRLEAHGAERQAGQTGRAAIDR